MFPFHDVVIWWLSGIFWFDQDMQTFFNLYLPVAAVGNAGFNQNTAAGNKKSAYSS